MKEDKSLTCHPKSSEAPMKKLAALTLCLVVGSLFVLPLACSQSDYKSAGPYANTPTPSPTTVTTPCPSCSPTPVRVYLGVGTNYSLAMSGSTISNPVTVAVNQSVIFDSSLGGHPLYVDNGTTCLVNNNSSFPVTFTPGSAANYLAHCALHGACTNNAACPASSCGGMAFTLHAQ